MQPPLVRDITLENSANGFGFTISGGLFTEHLKNDHGLFVTKIWPGGEADLDGKLAVGDRIISVREIIKLFSIADILNIILLELFFLIPRKI